MTDHGPWRYPVSPHLDEDGCCDCGCPQCTPERDNSDTPECICPDCNVEKCGMHGPLVVGGFPKPEKERSE